MSIKNAIGGISLIAGTAIGAAILALPVSTAHLSFVQTLALYGICWFFMTLGALYLLETNLFVGHGSNLISMAEKTLGKTGKWIIWVVYLLLLYALNAAYLNGAGSWIQAGLHHLNLALPLFFASLIATIITMAIIYCGTTITDWVNRALMIGLIATFVTWLFSTLGHIDSALLFQENPPLDIRPIPIIITAFGSAIVIPSITTYLRGNARQLLPVVLIGCAIPLIVYMLWELTIVGIIPSNALLQIQHHGNPVTEIPRVLETLLDNFTLSTVAFYFSIFALTTSVLGVSLSLFDFLADGLHLKKNPQSKVLLAVIAFLPPLAFILIYPRGFSIVLSFAGIFVSIILGIFPVLMAWQGRYRLAMSNTFRIIGGKSLMILTLLFFVAVIALECTNVCSSFGLL